MGEIEIHLEAWIGGDPKSVEKYVEKIRKIAKTIIKKGANENVQVFYRSWAPVPFPEKKMEGKK